MVNVKHKLRNLEAFEDIHEDKEKFRRLNHTFIADFIYVNTVIVFLVLLPGKKQTNKQTNISFLLYLHSWSFATIVDIFLLVRSYNWYL
jgi:hypothetical protein